MAKKRKKRGEGKSAHLEPMPVRQRSAQEKKKRKPPEGVGTTHKARSNRFRQSAAWPAREAPIQRLVRERRRVERALPSASAAAQWESLGPTNVGGRMTAIAADPTDPDRVWAGAAGGGVWKSEDAGRAWTPLWHKQDSLNVGALAIDPKHPNVLYCGTGEANLSADSYPGVGLFKSTNSGGRWRLLAPSAGGVLPARIGAIAFDPFDSRHLFLGGVGHHYPYEPGDDGLGGLYESLDGGRTWLRLNFISAAEYRCHAVVFHPTVRGLLYVTIAEQGSQNGIWRSDDGGAHWEHLTEGLPSSELFDRTSLAIARSNPSVIYALAADAGSAVLGVFRSGDGGDAWRDVSGSHFDREGQMTYNNTIVVHPEDAAHVLCGGVDLHLTTDGGTSWRKVTRWDAEPGRPNYAHADHHALLMPASRPGRVYDLNDGGMDVSEDGGRTWTNRSKGLAVTMYYDLDRAQSNADFFGGGSQDNGTPATFTGAPDDHQDLTGGDGGWLVFDPTNENHVYASIYYMNIFRFPSGTGDWEEVSPPAGQWEKNQVWMCYIAMDPADPGVVFTGSRRVWRTRDDGKNWKAVSHFFAGAITAIEVARADRLRVYVGTENGNFHRSVDGGDTWSGDLASANLPGYQISRIAARPDNADHLIAVVANFGRSHVYRSMDGGLTWEDVDRGRLPDVPHNGIAIPWARPDEIYVANDVGVFVSRDFGESWRNLSRNLPNVNVVDLVYHNRTRTLTAATYGRGLWSLKLK